MVVDVLLLLSVFPSSLSSLRPSDAVLCLAVGCRMSEQRDRSPPARRSSRRP